MTISFFSIIPKSPWQASVPWTKNDGVPVDENVAASFLHTCPDLPTPKKSLKQLEKENKIKILKN